MRGRERRRRGRLRSLCEEAGIEKEATSGNSEEKDNELPAEATDERHRRPKQYAARRRYLQPDDEPAEPPTVRNDAWSDHGGAKAFHLHMVFSAACMDPHHHRF